MTIGGKARFVRIISITPLEGVAEVTLAGDRNTVTSVTALLHEQQLIHTSDY